MRSGRYRWVESSWTDDEGSRGLSHTSLVVTRAGEVAFGRATEPALVVLAPASGRARTVAVADVTELHGLALVEEDGVELLWIADTGTKFLAGGDRLAKVDGPPGGQVLAIDLNGRRRTSLAPPPHEAYDAAQYSPTSVVVDETRHGGNGDIWVADGYGADLVHRFDAQGTYVASLSGAEGAGRFRCPHALLIDRRKAKPELYVADRRNARLQVYDLDGRYRRTVGEHVLVGPTWMAVSGDNLLVTDLIARRLTVFGPNDELLAHLFGHPEPLAWGASRDDEGWPAGWPNEAAPDGTIVRPALRPGVLNGPHGVVADATGRVYLTELVVGGRLVELEPRETSHVDRGGSDG